MTDQNAFALERENDELKGLLAHAVRIGLNGDKRSLYKLAERAIRKQGLHNWLQPVLDIHPDMKGSVLRSDPDEVDS